MVPIQGRREYDVKLAVSEVKIPAYWTKKDIEQYHGLWDKRIDLVVHASDAVWIIEIKPKLTMTAIGQCLSYQELYEKEFKPDKEIKLGIICEADDPNFHSTLEKLDIKLWVV